MPPLRSPSAPSAAPRLSALTAVPPRPAGGPFAKRHLRRWRIASLIGVHALFAVHFLHWKLKGASLAPMEFSESLHTLHDGVITVGFLFAVAAILATLAFGRYFCGWGCHILAIQDACAWLLGRLGIKAKPLRSRAMALLPLAITAYLYLWPQLLRLVAHAPQPPFRFQGDLEGWGSLTTRHLFRAMPGPAFAVLTLLICGAVMVYFLGSRSFCSSICPYGVFFGFADRFSPARLVLSGACEGCGLCTLNCKSGVKVIQELKQFGTVMDTACLRSMDCVAGCPTGAIGTGFKIPWGFSGKDKRPPPKQAKRFDFSLGEEVLFAAVFLLLMAVYRGLYEIGIFLAASIGVIGAGAVVRCLRVYRSRGMASAARPRTPRPEGFSVRAKIGSAAFLLVTAHSAFVHAHAFLGDRLFGKPESGAECARHLRLAVASAWFRLPDADRKLAITAASLGDWNGSRAAFARYLDDYPNDVAMRVQFGSMLSQSGDARSAEDEYRAALVPDSLLAIKDEKPWRAMARSLLAQRQASAGDAVSAAAGLQAAIADDPWDASHPCNLGYLYLRMGEAGKARAILEAARLRLGSVTCVEQLSAMAGGGKRPAPAGSFP